MNQEDQEFCFCTVAFSHTYRSLALKLAKDLEKYAPDIPFIVFTDKPEVFSGQSNVLVTKHRRKGVLVYHERRFAIAQALTMFNSCMYLDADVRICDNVPQRKWLPGITAKSSYPLLKHHQSVIEGKNQKPWRYKAWSLIRDMADKLDLDLEKDDIQFINEFLFVVTRASGVEQEFLQLWDKLAIYSDLHGVHKGPGNAMGLAAAKVGFPVRRDEMAGLDFFDDRVERWKIQQGKADPADKQAYFDAQNTIENSRRSLLTRAVAKARKSLEYFYHSVRLKITTAGKDII